MASNNHGSTSTTFFFFRLHLTFVFTSNNYRFINVPKASFKAATPGSPHFEAESDLPENFNRIWYTGLTCSTLARALAIITIAIACKLAHNFGVENWLNLLLGVAIIFGRDPSTQLPALISTSSDSALSTQTPVPNAAPRH